MNNFGCLATRVGQLPAEHAKVEQGFIGFNSTVDDATEHQYSLLTNKRVFLREDVKYFLADFV